MVKRMQGVDTAFFVAETPTMHLHVVGVMLLDPSTASAGWDRGTVVDLLAERLHLLPPFRWRPVPVPGGLDQPRWIEDPDFCLEEHVVRAELPAPADHDALCAFVGEVASRPLRRDRPLWEMHVVDRLDDGSVAIVTKLHHSFMDGGAGGDVLASLFDLGPTAEPVPPPAEPWRSEVPPPPAQLLVESVGGALARTARLPTVLLDTATSLARAAQVVRERRAPETPLLGPRTPLNGSLSAERVVALTRCSLTDVKAVRAAAGVTVNDVVLAATTAALRAELLERGVVPDGPLLAMMPISERDAGDTSFSNRTTAAQVGLPVQVADPLERLATVHDMALDAKDLHRALGDGMTEGWAALLPPPLLRAAALAYTTSGAARLVPPAFNVVVSNVPGPPIPLYLGGARVTDIYPMGPLLEGAGLNITLLSQADLIDVGIIACPTMVDDPARVADRFTTAIDELVSLTAAGAATPATGGT